MFVAGAVALVFAYEMGVLFLSSGWRWHQLAMDAGLVVGGALIVLAVLL
jgi:hypothetical protein